MTDPVKKYQECAREYAKAQEAALQRMRMIEDVSSALRSHLSGFLFRNYSLPTVTREAYFAGQRDGFNMKLWPDAEELRSILTEWHSAYVSLREAWNAVPTEDRIGLQPPPEKMNWTT